MENNLASLMMIKKREWLENRPREREREREMLLIIK